MKTYKKNPNYKKTRNKWMKNNKDKIIKTKKLCLKRNKEIISLLRKKYNVKLLSDIITKIKQEGDKK